jgi:hypothetical protein
MTAVIRLVALLAGSGVLALGGSDRPELAPGVPATRAARAPADGNQPYRGRFTFIRLRFTATGGTMYDREEGVLPAWKHDYPRGETHFMRILDDLTTIAGRMDGGNILDLDDPELSKYPLAYMCEPGYWSQTDEEAKAFGDWLRKGGFVIFDDFRGEDIRNLQVQMARVLPGAVMKELDVSDPIFHSFFDIASLDFSAPTFRRYKPVFLGIYEDNDPAKRLMAIINYDNDISEYWEWSDTGFQPVQTTNEAYKLGVNYVVYGMTH